MRAVTISELGGPASLSVTDLPVPVRGDGEVLVAVRAVAPAFPDLLLSRGEYQVKPELPFTPGADFAGTVLEAEPDSGFAPGQRVAGCLLFGAAAERIAVAADLVHPVPEGMAFEEAAALPMNYLTAYYALVVRGEAKAGDWVLVTGSSGGVGLATIQIAKGIGCRVIALVSGPHRSALVTGAGADFVVGADGLREQVRQITDEAGVDVVVDMVGGDVTDLLRTLRALGRLMVVGFASGEIPTVRVNRLLLNNTDVRGVDSARMIFETEEARDAWTHLMQLVEEGSIRPVITRGGDLAQFGEVLTRLSDRSSSGRVILTVDTASAV